MSQYILAIDQGTTSSRAVLYDEKFDRVALSQRPFPQHFPETDWVEHDLEDIWTSVSSAIIDLLAQMARLGIEPSQIAALALTNQRETFGLWERVSGKPLGRAIVWQCRRSAALCEKLRRNAAARKVAKDAGLVLDPYFSGTKLKWLFDKNPSWRARAKKDEICFGTIDSFLVWRLSDGRSHKTDVTNASRTLLMNLKTRRWNPAALKLFGVPETMLPEICDSNADFGKTKGLGFLPDGIPICGILGDQQAALLGQGCVVPGEAKITYGTGAFLLANVGPKPIVSPNGLSTVAWTLNGKTAYALEGALFIAGAAVQFLRDNLGIIAKSSDIESLARSVPDSDGVFFVPALTGLGSPYWEPEAKGLLGGLTRRSSKGHIARACLEGITASVADLADGLMPKKAAKLKTLLADGGAAANTLLLQMQADDLGVTVVRPADLESTVRGAAFAAGLRLGWIRSLAELKQKNPRDVELRPTISAAKRKERLKIWRRRVGGLLKGAY